MVRSTEKNSTEKLPSRSFGILFSIVSFVLAFYTQYQSIFIGIGIILLVIGLTLPSLLNWPTKLWLKFGYLLHKITNPLIMGILYYGLVTPLGLFLRAIGKDFLRVRVPLSNKTSFWVTRAPVEGESMEKQF